MVAALLTRFTVLRFIGPLQSSAHQAGRRGCSFVADDLHEVGIAGDLTMKANMLREAGTGCKALQWPVGKSLLVTGTGARLSRNGQ